MENYSQAIADLEKALEIGFNQSVCYYNLGMAYEYMKDTENAAITYTPTEDFEYGNAADGEGILINGFKNTREIDGKPVTEIGAEKKIL
jgi:tetratricopeptide (TPR) repeat protein